MVWRWHLFQDISHQNSLKINMRFPHNQKNQCVCTLVCSQSAEKKTISLLALRFCSTDLLYMRFIWALCRTITCMHHLKRCDTTNNQRYLIFSCCKWSCSLTYNLLTSYIIQVNLHNLVLKCVRANYEREDVQTKNWYIALVIKWRIMNTDGSKGSITPPCHPRTKWRFIWLIRNRFKSQRVLSPPTFAISSLDFLSFSFVSLISASPAKWELWSSEHDTL